MCIHETQGSGMGMTYVYVEEEEEEAFYIRVPSPIGLIGWNIQRKTKHKR